MTTQNRQKSNAEKKDILHTIWRDMGTYSYSLFPSSRILVYKLNEFSVMICHDLTVKQRFSVPIQASQMTTIRCIRKEMYVQRSMGE